MKRLFFTLAICLFTLGAYASNVFPNEDPTAINNAFEKLQSFQEVLPTCTILVTEIITINHGTWIETITITHIEPCPFGY